MLYLELGGEIWRNCLLFLYALLIISDTNSCQEIIYLTLLIDHALTKKKSKFVHTIEVTTHRVGCNCKACDFTVRKSWVVLTHFGYLN